MVFQVFVRLPSGTRAVSIETHTSAVEVKETLSVPQDHRLSFQSTCIHDESRSLTDYGITAYSTLTLTPRLAGGAAYCLPGNMMHMFAARPPVEHWKFETKRKNPPYSGMSSFLNSFNEHVDPLAGIHQETISERKERIQRERQAANEKRIQEQLSTWDPSSDEKIQGNAFKTLFVARLSFETSDTRLKREFEQYGPIRRVSMIRDHNKRSRGYAFIEFESERDMKRAYKQADSQKVDGRRILVDVERGRTVKDWRPRRLGGGLGKTRDAKKKAEKKKKKPVVDEAPPRRSFGGGPGGYGGDRDRGAGAGDRGGGGFRGGDRAPRDNPNRTPLGSGSLTSGPSGAPPSASRDRGRDSDRGRDRDRDSDRGRDSHRSRDRSRERDRSRDRDRHDRSSSRSDRRY